MSWPKSVRGIAFALGAGLIAWGLAERYSFSRLKSSGAEAIVEPVADYRESHAGRGGTRYVSDFAFTTAEGQRVAVQREFPEALIADIRARQPIKVRYEAARPAEFVFEKEDAPWSFILAGFILIVVAAVRK
jgi:hypothetical protein